MSAPSIRYQSWTEFKSKLFPSLCGTQEPQVSRFLFRGQRDPTWMLVPSFHRYFGHYDENARRIALNTLRGKFEKYCESEPSLKALLESNNHHQLTAFAQHSGLPTELLDWTESPFIAVFFAATDHLQTRQSLQEISVWAIDTFNPIWLAGDERACLPPPFTVPSWNNSRLRSQRGWFTLLDPEFTSFESWVLAQKYGDQAIRKYVIELNENIDEILIELQLMGINHGSLFPDPSGWANASLLDTLLRLRQTERMPHIYPWNMTNYG